MKRDTQGAILLAVGAVVLTLTVSGAYQSYVRTGLRLPLLAAGAVLAVLGGSAIVIRPEGSAGDDGHGHGSVSLRIGFILLALVMTAYLIAPAPLGAYAAARGDENRVVFADRTEVALPAPTTVTTAPQVERDDPPIATTSSTLLRPGGLEDPPPPQPLDPAAGDQGAVLEQSGPIDPDSGEILAMPIYDFLTYTLFEPDEIGGRTVRLVGFVAAEPEIEGAYRLTRFLMACCAADAFPLQVIVTGASPPPLDRWVELDAVWNGEVIELDEFTEIPVVEVVDQTEIDAPDQPYEY